MHSNQKTDTADSGTPDSGRQIAELLDMVDSDSLQERLPAIHILGEVGDLPVLQRLRERLAQVSPELQSPVFAVGKLKRRLRVK